MRELDEEVLRTVRQQTSAGSSARKDLENAKASVAELFLKVALPLPPAPTLTPTRCTCASSRSRPPTRNGRRGGEGSSRRST